MKRISLLVAAVYLTSACSSIERRSDIAAQAAQVDCQELERTILDLNSIGPRPVSDEEATAATVSYLAGRLHALGYEIEEHPVELTLPSVFLAQVRSASDPEAEMVDLAVDPALIASGSHAMNHQSAILHDSGWEVEGYFVDGRNGTRLVSPPNLFATLRGSVLPNEVVEVSAHYDTVPNCPGANDNSSGVAAVMEVARLIAELPLKRTVRLCFFAAEEVGMSGSKAHVANLIDDSTETVVALVNLDPVGFATTGRGSQRQLPELSWFLRPFLDFPNEADFIVVVGKSSSAWLGALVEDVCSTYVPGLPVYGANRIGHRFRDARRSDHKHYWDAGIPAVFVTDTGEFRNATYHGPEDLPETLNFDFLTSVTRATLAATLHLADG